MSAKIIGFVPKRAKALVLRRTREDRYEGILINDWENAHHFRGLRGDMVILLNGDISEERLLDVRIALACHVSDNSRSDCTAVDDTKGADA